jgi:hypothetical protein
VQSEIATVIDATLLADLVNAAYRGAGGRYGWTHEAALIGGDRISSTGVAATIGDGSTAVLVRRGDNRPPLSAVSSSR